MATVRNNRNQVNNQANQTGQDQGPGSGGGKPPIPYSVQKNIIAYLRKCWQDFPYDEVRARLTYCDKLYSRSNVTNSARDERIRNSTGVMPINVPVVQPQVDTMHSKLVDIFCTGNPMFSYVAGPENMQAMKALNALSNQHQKIGSYESEMIIWLKDATKYNIHGAEVEWTSTRTPTFLNPNVEAANTSDAAVAFDSYYYNKFERVDMYNAFWDMVVRPAQVHKIGEFAGYHKRVNKVELKRIIESYGGQHTMNATRAYESAYDHAMDAIADPSIIPSYAAEQSSQRLNGQNWDSFFGVEKKGGINFQNSYVLTTAYIRATPEDFGIAGDKSSTLRIYKILMVNFSQIVMWKEVTDAHDMFGFVIGQPMDDGLGLQTQSLTERLAPIQQLVTQLHISRVADLVRSIADRGIYDPLLLDPKQINNPNPAAKIPILPIGYGRLKDMAPYIPMEYRNSNGGTLLNEANVVMKYGEDIAGLNPMQRGIPIKGNRTLGEFEEVAGNADVRNLVIALLIESQTLTPIKEMLKVNILQYQKEITVFDRTTGEQAKVQPSQIRSIQFDFDVADGLKPTTLFENPDLLLGAMQYIMSNPDFMLEYDVVGLFAYAFQTKGAKNLESFRRTPEQQKAFIEQKAAMNAAANATVQPPPQQPQ